MKLEKFKEVLDTIRKTDNDIETLRKLGIDIIDTELCKSYWVLQALAFTEAYGEDGWDGFRGHCMMPLVCWRRAKKTEMKKRNILLGRRMVHP